VIWDTLAILEYVAETWPGKQLWPKGREARARARSISAEMHSGFQALRGACPMNLRRTPKAIKFSDAVLKDVVRIEEIWRDCRKKYGKGGPFLFGRFSNADAMFAPVVSRLVTYDIRVKPDTKKYMTAVIESAGFRSWQAAALKEPWIVPEDEVD
jgi:glutathione S-transferase